MSSSHKTTFQRGCSSYLPRQLSRPGAAGSRISWRADLRRLVAARLPDAQIARLLSRLYPSHPFTAWKVWYYRQQLSASLDEETPRERQRLAVNRYQLERGLGDLLPEIDQPISKAWKPGLELTRRQVDLLCCLRDHGPLTFAELTAALRVDKARVSRLLAVLLFLQLVRREPSHQRGRYRACC